MSDKQVRVRVDVDVTGVDKKASEASTSLWRTLTDDKGALKAAKDKIDSLMASITTTGKINMPMDEFAKALNATKEALVKMRRDNESVINELIPKYDKLKQAMTAAWQSHDDAGQAKAQRALQPIERELNQRKQLDTSIREQELALAKLNAEVQNNTTNQNNAARTTQQLSQKVAELKKRMNELAIAGQQDSNEYAELSRRAAELQKNINALNAGFETQQAEQNNTRTSSASLRREITQIAVELAQMEKAGLRGTEAYNQLQARGAALTDAMGDARQQMRLLAHDNAGLQGVMDGLNGITGAFTMATGAAALFGSENEELQRTMMKLQAVMSISMGLQQMLNALNKDSAFRLGVIGKLQNWWTACKAKAAAATTAETGAVVANTTAQTAQNAVVATGTTVNAAHAASWKAVGIAIKSALPVGMIVAAIGAVIGAVSSLIGKSEEERKELERQKEARKQAMEELEEWRKALNSVNLDHEKNAQREIKNIRYLCDAAADETKSREERLKIAKKLKEQYPDYFGQLSTEQIMLGKTAKAYDKLVASILKTARARAYADKYVEIEDQILDLKEKQLQNTHNWEEAAKSRDLHEDLAEFYLKHDLKKAAVHNEAYQEAHIKMFNLQLEYDINSTKLNEAEEKLKSIVKKSGITEEQIAMSRGEIISWEDEEKEKQDDKKLPAADMTKDDIKRKKENVAKTYDELMKAVADHAKQMKGQRVKLANDVEQAEINAMQDGLSRRIRQRAFDDKLESEQLEQRLNDEIQTIVSRAEKLHEANEKYKKSVAELQGKEYTRQNFDFGNLLSYDIKIDMTDQQIGELAGDEATVAQIKSLINAYQRIWTSAKKQRENQNADEQAEAQLAMAEYLRQYGTFEEKKLAIAAIYAAKRAKATTDAEQMQLAQEESKALNDVEFDDFMTSRAALAFGEIDNLSRDSITRLIAEMEKYRDEVTRTFDPDKIEKFNQALTNLKSAQAMSDGGMFSQLFTPTYFKERKAALAEINAAEKTHNDLLSAKLLKEAEVKKSTDEIIAKVKELTGQNLTPDQVKDGSTVTNIIGQLSANGDQQGAADLSDLIGNLDGARAQLGQVTTASNQAGNSLVRLKEAFAGKFTDQGGALAMVDTIVHGINDIVQGANETVKELAGTADALGADTSVGSGWDKAQTFMQGFADASAGATEAFDSLKSGNFMGVISGITKSFTSWIKAFAAIHDASRERTIQRLQDEIEELERINKRIEHNLASQYSKQASKSYETEIRNLEKQRQLIQQQIAAEEDKKNTDDDRIQEWQDKLEELGWQIEEYKDKALDAIIGEDISTSIDNFADALADTWNRTGDRARQTKELVRNMLRQMVVEAMKTDLTEPVRQLREMMAEAIDDDVVTAAEQRQLEEFAKQLAKTTQQKYNWADKLMEDTNSQSGATSGGFATASQDSVEELNGRAAAIQICAERRRELLQALNVDVAQIKAQVAQNNVMAEETRNLQLLAVGHLESISRNTSQLYEMNERLGKIEKNTRRL